MPSSLNTSTKESIFYMAPTLLLDFIIQCAVLYFLRYATDMIRPGNLVLYERTGTLLIMGVSVLLAMGVVGFHLNERNRSTITLIGLSILYSFLTWGLFNGLMAIIYELTLQGKLLTLQLLLSTLLICMGHLLVRGTIALIRKKGANNYTVLMIGADPNLNEIYNTLHEGTSLSEGYLILGYFTDQPGSIPPDANYLGPVEDCFAYLTAHAYTTKEVLCSLNPATETDLVNRIVNLCEGKMIRFKYVPNMEGYPKRALRFSRVGNVNVISLHEEPMNNLWAKLAKRTLDMLVSGLFLMTLFPFIWLFCAIGIKLSSPGPVFFRQKRTGYEGKEFLCLKFRSMHQSSDADTKQAVKGDSRVFRFGAFLRKSSLDELPQFINVLKGDMSIVGPRPHMLHHTDVYSALISDYMVRHYAKPGITGWAQVNGCRGETRELDQMQRRVQLDIWYIEHWSVGLDIYIFFLTAWQLVRHRDEQAY